MANLQHFYPTIEIQFHKILRAACANILLLKNLQSHTVVGFLLTTNFV